VSPRRRRNLGTAGFTLVELIVALAVVGTMLAAMPAALGRMYDTMQYRATVRDLLAELKGARLEAMSSGRPTVFAVDVEARRFGTGGRQTGEIPPGLEVKALVAESETADGRMGIRFYPDGSATGGSIEIVRTSGAGLRLRVDWLLGRVSQEPLSQ